jgi:hypothetical protein
MKQEKRAKFMVDISQVCASFNKKQASSKMLLPLKGYSDSVLVPLCNS